MKYLKLPFILLILLFNHNVFSQASSTEATQEYTENLSIELYALSADFFQGYKEIRRKEFKKTIQNNPTAYRNYVTGVNLRIFGNLTCLGSLIALGVGVSLTSYGVVDKWVLPTGLSTLLVGILMNSVGRSKLKKSVDVYNQVYDYGWKIGVTENGVGLVITF